MKQFTLLLLLLVGLSAKSASFTFPNVEFSYAKLYFFNLKLDKPSGMDFAIYDKGVYAASKLGTGLILSKSFLDKVENTLKNGVEELVMGLGKCYMPRHGIIYYDENNMPVASLSVCFECDRISLWSKTPLRVKQDVANFDFDKAEKQIAELQKIFRDEKIPVYTSPADEHKYWNAFKTDTTDIKPNVLLISDSTALPKIPAVIRKMDLEEWLSSNAGTTYHGGIDTTTSNEAGSKIGQMRLNYEKNTFFKFDGSNVYYGEIGSPKILLPDGISIGMSVLEFYQRMGYTVPDGPLPVSGNISNGKWQVLLDFTNETLTKITLIRI